MNKRYIIGFTLLTAFSLSSCDDFLDTMPDDRAEVDTEAKVTSMLVSAYPSQSSVMMAEYATDNVMDNGSEYTIYYLDQEQAYLWKDITEEGNDDPKYVWQGYYRAIASANQALQAIEDLGNPASLNPQKAEALLCRAYSHFQLANLFCKAYNPETADTDMGLPYSIEPETTVSIHYERGTLAEFYAQINKDIETALPLVDDKIYSVPKYHFNKKAAYAFAARFNLYYVQSDKSNYEKVIKYATEVVTSTPERVLRNWSNYLSYGRADLSNAYVQASDACNLLMIPAYSKAGRLGAGMGPRYNHNRPIVTYETYWTLGPWKSSGSGAFLIYGRKLYGSNQCVMLPKLDEFWEYTDKTSGTGYAHIVDVVFTTDETLLCRAEAYAILGRYDEATADLNAWQTSHCVPSYVNERTGETFVLEPLTREYINEFYAGIAYSPLVPSAEDGSDRTIKKPLNPQGFTVSPGEQENFIQCVLHFRRLETMHTGLRWYDIKRYGIEISHNREGLAADVLEVNDLRRVFQLPSDVIDAGLTANPR